MIETIGESIQQRRPFPSIHTEALVALLRTADLAWESIRRELAPHGLSLQQYNVLRILRGAGRQGLGTYEVAARMVSRAPNITRLVDKLEDKGLLERARSRSDRRVVELRISSAGRRLLARLDQPVQRADRQAMRGLRTAELRGLIALLDQLRHPLEESG